MPWQFVCKKPFQMTIHLDAARPKKKRATRARFRVCLTFDPAYSGRSSLKVRCPEIIVETIDWRDMISSRMAA